MLARRTSTYPPSSPASSRLWEVNKTGLDFPADGDADAKRRLRLELAAQTGGDTIAAEIGKRLTVLRSARSFIDWQKRRDFVKDLELQRAMIVDRRPPARVRRRPLRRPRRIDVGPAPTGAPRVRGVGRPSQIEGGLSRLMNLVPSIPMRWFWEQAIGDAPGPDGKPDPVYWRKLAQESAEKCAVYLHPRLSSVDASVTGEVRHAYVSAVPLTEEEWQPNTTATTMTTTPRNTPMSYIEDHDHGEEVTELAPVARHHVLVVAIVVEPQNLPAGRCRKGQTRPIVHKRPPKPAVIWGISV